MNIPAWLRRYLPLFTHICPKCKKEVKANSHQCPHCGEKYPLTVRVPPKFLNDKKALEEYVHKNVFPRVSAFERRYLTQFFTVFFSDTFASGNFSAWSGTSGTCSIVTSPVYNGASYAAETNTGYIYKTLSTSYSSLYARVYAYFPSLPGGNNLLYFQDSSWAYSVGIQIFPTYLDVQLNWSSVASVAETWSLSTWYCFELYAANGSGNGTITAWINGVQAVTSTNNTFSFTFQNVFLGSNNNAIYFEYAVVGNAYNGPLQTNINVSDSGSGSDAIASLQANVPISDAGSGSDALSSLQAQITVSDAGAGADNDGVQGTISVSDVSSGADSIASLQGQIPVYDSGLGSDVASLAAQVPITDSGAGSDNAVVGSKVNVSDSGDGSDSASIIAQIPVTDVGLGTDSIAVGSPVNLSDSGLGSDVVAIQAQILVIDVGASLDSAIVNVSTVLSDVGLGSDVLAIAVPISISDTGLGADTIIVIVPRLSTHAVVIQSETGKVTMQTEKGTVTLKSDSD